MSVTLDLDDLESFDGFDSGMRTPETPGSPLAPMYSPVGMMIGQNSPTRGVLSGGEGLYGRHQAHTVHGVHMHTHENTKVPLLNHAVDRTNSSRPSYPPVSQETQGGLSMAELFLRKESNNRQSLNRNYESIHALLDDDGIGAIVRRSSNDGTETSDRVVVATDLNDDEAQMEIDAFAAAIDPTPWSEIEQEIHNAQESGVSTTFHPHHYSYYPYGRHHQLPIPYRPPPSPPMETPIAGMESLQGRVSTSLETKTLQDALATAAQLASVGATVDVAGAMTKPNASLTVAPPAPTPGSKQFTSSSTNAPMNSKASIQDPDTATAPPVLPAAQQYQLKRATYSPPQHATAHTTSRASVLAAANKKAQYGFGGNHVVPSVPAPPPSASTRGSDKSIQKTVLAPPPSSEASTGYSGVAYERKKQRAKDARIKLNEAIERLSIAMNLSGTQSKQRIHLLNSRIRQTEQRTKSLHIADECIKLAEQAKKWDRPSFLSSAASIVQALNSQCESLSRELVCLQERLDTTTGASGGVPGTIPPPSMQVTEERNHKRSESPTPNQSPAKRIKTDYSANNSNSPDRAIEPSDLDETVLVHIAKLLDHVSLAQCVSVSRKWRSIQAFENDDVWFQLAVKRFGFYNVRQWAEKLEDSENEFLDLSKKAMFRAMSSANVMPHIQHPNGVSLLGDAKIPGRVSAWVFMVDRSNGETLRSVKRDPSRNCAVGAGSYQSRPVVELRIVIQNTGMAKGPVVIKEQKFIVDISTRRSGGELDEIEWDERFSKIVKTLDGLQYHPPGSIPNGSSADGQRELCRLALFEAAEITIHVDARGCSTSSKFRQKSNFTKVLVSLEGTTVPMVIPFAR